MFAALAGLDVAVDRLAVGGGEQDPAGDAAGLVEGLVDDVVVEHGLVDRNRDGLVGPEADRVRELPLVLDPVDVEGADADAVRREPEPDAAARQLVLLEEAVERPCERGHVAHLAADDDAAVERPARELEEVGGAVVHRLAPPRAATRRP